MASLSILSLCYIPNVFRKSINSIDESSQAFVSSKNTINSKSKIRVPSLSFSRDFRYSGVKSSTEVVNDHTIVESEKRREKGKVLRVGLVCGGPSAERGISLNSARSVLDHTQGNDLHVSCYYIDCEPNAYAISLTQLYSNTPADFDFKIESLAQGFRSLFDFAEHLAASVDIVFPVIHSPFGEDGSIQYEASLELGRKGFMTVTCFLAQGRESNETDLLKWFERNELDINAGKVVVKPARGGSSIEVELQFHGNADVREKDAIFNYQRKYLPTQQQVAYRTSPRFPIDVIEVIGEGALLLFQRLGLREFAMIDGWYLCSSSQISSSGQEFGKTESGIVLFTDINLISGMEQTSFLFQQASKVGFSHSNILRTILHHACSRFPNLVSHFGESHSLVGRQIKKSISKRNDVRKVFVIFGGDTSERQVSLLSGTNVWLNLQAFDDLDMTPCLLASTISSYTQSTKEVDLSSTSVWSLPYSLVLRHTTEEVLASCMEALEPDQAALTSHLRKQVMSDLVEGVKKDNWFTGFDVSDESSMKYYSLEEWIKLAKEVQATVFIAGSTSLPSFYPI